MKKHELEAYEKAGIKVTICKPAKARGSQSFSNFKSNSKRMRTYRTFDKPQGHKVSSIYDLGPETENAGNEGNASNGGKATNGFNGNHIHSFNQYNNR